MKKIIVCVLVLGFFAAFTSESYGQVTRRADQRQKNQKHRVKTGAKSGEITKREGKSIKRSSTHAKRYEKRAKSDGKVTWVERRRLERKFERLCRRLEIVGFTGW